MPDAPEQLVTASAVPGSLVAAIAGWSGRYRWVVIGLWGIILLVAASTWWSPRTADPEPASAPFPKTHQVTRETQLICADGQNTVLWKSVDFSPAGLETTDSARIGQLIASCYVSIWEGTPLELPVGDAGVLVPEEISTGNLPLISPQLVETWQAGLDETVTLDSLANTTWEDLIRAERIALPLAWLILAVATRSLLLPLVPLLTGTLAALLAPRILDYVVETTALNALVMAVVAMIGLALGIDYALLTVLHRHHRAGHPAATVAAAGFTVIGTASALLIVPVETLRHLSIGVVIAAALCVVLTITLVPALLARIPTRTDDPPTPSPAPQPGTRINASLARLIAVVVLGALVATAWQAQNLETGLTNPFVTVEDQPAAGAEGYEAYLRHEMTMARLSTVEVTIAGQNDARAADALMVAIGRDPDFAPIVLLEHQMDRDHLTVRTLLIHPWGAAETSTAIHRLLYTTVPEIAHQNDTNLTVRGPLVLHASTIETIQQLQTQAGLLALGATWVLLLILQRNIVMAGLALGGSLLSFGAALGILRLLTARDTFLPSGPVETWVPVVMFAIMLGLGVDYHLFLTHTIRPPGQSGLVVFGQPATGVVRVVIASALIMTCVFGGFAISSQLALQQLGIGLAVGVMLDAFVVRVLLLPCLARSFTRASEG